MEENQTPQTPKKKHKVPVKYILNISIVLLVTAVAVSITLATSFNEVVSAFARADWGYIAIAGAMMVGAAACTSLILFCFARLYTRKYRFLQAVACDGIGRFWSGVTPGATGGQFMQAYTYKKQGIAISSAASIVIMNSIVYQVVLILLGIISLCAKGNTLLEINAIEFTINGQKVSVPVIPLVIIGFGLNIGFIAILFLMSYSKRFHNFILGPIISLLHKMHLVKDPDKKRESLRIQVENFKIELKRLFSNVPFLLLVVLITFMTLILIDGIPCICAKALGCSQEITVDSFATSVFYSNFHQMVTGLIPIPGAAGVSEYFFWALFKDYFTMPDGSNVAAAGQLMWRTITFTIPLVIGGFIAAFYRCSPNQEAAEAPSISRETFVTMSHQTLDERALSAKEQFETSKLSRSEIMSKLSPKKKREKRKDKKKAAEEAEWDVVDLKNEDDDK